MKNEKYYNIKTISKSNITIIETGKIYTPKAYDISLSCLGTGTSIKSGGVKLALWVQINGSMQN